MPPSPSFALVPLVLLVVMCAHVFGRSLHEQVKAWADEGMAGQGPNSFTVLEQAQLSGAAMNTPATFTQNVFDTTDACDKTDRKIVTKIALSTSTSQHCVEVDNWGKVIATCNGGILTFTLFDNDNCTGHSAAGNRSWALGDCVQGFGKSWLYTDCQETTPAAPTAKAEAKAKAKSPPLFRKCPVIQPLPPPAQTLADLHPCDVSVIAAMGDSVRFFHLLRLFVVVLGFWYGAPYHSVGVLLFCVVPLRCWVVAVVAVVVRD